MFGLGRMLRHKNYLNQDLLLFLALCLFIRCDHIVLNVV